MKHPNFNFQLMMGVTASRNMPEELSNNIAKHIEENISPKVNEEIEQLVRDYCTENDLDIPTSIRAEKTAIKDEDGFNSFVEDFNSPKNTMEDFFKKLGEKKGIEVRSQRSSGNFEKGIKELKRDLENLTKTINPDSSDEEKSLLAYEILSIRVRIEKLKVEDSFGSLKQETKNKLGRAISMRDKLPAEEQDTIDSVDKDFKRIEILLTQCNENLDKLIVVNFEEYKAMSYEDRGKFLKAMKKELDSLTEYLTEELNGIKDKLISVMTGRMNFGDHLRSVLN